MIEAVSTLSVQSAALRANTQSASSFVAAVPAPKPPNMGFLSIRMDDKVNLAILEYKSSEGEVIRQYPSESQIRAFQRSSELQEKQQQARAAEQQAAAAPEGPSFEVSSVAPTPTQVTASPATGGTEDVAAASPSTGSTQSVVV